MATSPQVSSDAMEVDIPLSSPKPRDSDASLLATHTLPSPSVAVEQSDSYTVGYVYSTELTKHFYQKDPGDHVEQPARIVKIWDLIVSAQLNTRMKSIDVREVKKNEALLVHSADHWDKILAIEKMTDQEIADSERFYEQLSLYVMPATTKAALLSCGGVIEACLAVARGELKKVVAIVRPPGHHAEPEEHMGFCFLNNVAVATRVVQRETSVKKVLIVDWDVHHGNGTHRAFVDDPTVLYVSLHRYEGGLFYPCGPLGGIQSCGEDSGRGFCVNIPWPEKGMGDADYIHAFQKIVMPIAMEFAPELVIVSAGFDAAAGDPLGECFVTPSGYAYMTHMLSGLAGGRLVVALEGGYNIDSTARSALAVTKVVLGEAPDPLPAMVASETGTEAVWLVAKEQSKYWKSVDPKASEPQEVYDAISFSIPEILSAHRRQYLIDTYGMMHVPLLREDLQQQFSTQIMCSQDILHNKTIIVFAHEFGNLRTDLESSARCDVQLELSYLIDFSKELIPWVRASGFSLLDVNLFPKPFTVPTTKHPNPGRDIMTYLWDNYVAISGAESVILIGHGPGCQAIMDLINSRSVGVMKRVRGVVQVVGLSKVPMTPKYSEDLRSWYTERSLVTIPQSHPAQNAPAKVAKRHGSLLSIDETRPMKLIMKALPSIKEFIQRELGCSPTL